MGPQLAFLPVALVAIALLTLGVTGIVVYAIDRNRSDSQQSREAQFLAEQSLELTRQRAGRGTPPAGAALQSSALAADRCAACGLPLDDWHPDCYCTEAVA